MGGAKAAHEPNKRNEQEVIQPIQRRQGHLDGLLLPLHGQYRRSFLGFKSTNLQKSELHRPYRVSCRNHHRWLCCCTRHATYTLSLFQTDDSTAIIPKRIIADCCISWRRNHQRSKSKSQYHRTVVPAIRTGKRNGSACNCTSTGSHATRRQGRFQSLQIHHVLYRWHMYSDWS